MEIRFDEVDKSTDDKTQMNWDITVKEEILIAGNQEREVKKTGSKRSCDHLCPTETSVCKKNKTEDNDSTRQVFYAYAYLETWKNLRKEKRHKKFEGTVDVNLHKKQLPTSSELSEDSKDPMIMSVNADPKHLKKPKFCVKVTLQRAFDDENVCKTKFEAVNDDDVKTEFEKFQFFFAYVKKKIISVFK